MSERQVRQIGRYDFEGGAMVQIIATGSVATEEALEMVETIVALKRSEIASIREHEPEEMPSG